MCSAVQKTSCKAQEGKAGFDLPRSTAVFWGLTAVLVSFWGLTAVLVSVWCVSTAPRAS